ncbi:MAG: HAMP domain-containing histidine kinase [Lachnospiraceae bacterium]|nr:HAMP domain-containing histidine kinase [Lachnospiraceae bacterium]
MEFWLWVIIGIMAFVMMVLILKNRMLQKSAKEIKDAFADKLITDTNTLIDISCGDKYMRDLAAVVNQQLRELYKERRRFQQGDRELKNAITNISHDLRTPLTAISAYLDLLEQLPEQKEASEKVRHYLAQIRERTEALKKLVEELFRYSVVTSSPELKPERVNVVNVLEESLLSFYGMIQKKGIRPQIELPEIPVWRELDIGALNRIFSNIISNALKYTDGDFVVTMKEDGSIVFSNKAETLNPLIVGKLFDRFYTVEDNRNSTGLGLSIAKLLTERIGGLIGAEHIDGRLLIMVKF